MPNYEIEYKDKRGKECRFKSLAGLIGPAVSAFMMETKISYEHIISIVNIDTEKQTSKFF